eukprot:augustus_masked-scaffold_37-processed-gene-2.14-mRNA-1 protein AED:0.21 eAED:0.21 QI:0/-1/0/1/-1/1/1/0/182
MSHSELKENPSESDVAVQCEAPGCFFWGRPSTQNRCSKHYKELQEETAASSSTASSSSAEQDSPTSPPIQNDLSAVAEEQNPVLKEEGQKEVENEIRELQNEEEKAEKPVRPVQKDERFCMECKKFIGFLGNRCKCGFVYCAKHKYDNMHACDFDFEKRARERYDQRKGEAAVSDKISGERL